MSGREGVDLARELIIERNVRPSALPRHEFEPARGGLGRCLNEDAGVEPTTASLRGIGVSSTGKPAVDDDRGVGRPPFHRPGGLLLDRLDNECRRGAAPTHFSLLEQAVTASGGAEVKNLGDGLLVVFPGPIQAARTQWPCNGPSRNTMDPELGPKSACESGCTPARTAISDLEDERGVPRSSPRSVLEPRVRRAAPAVPRARYGRRRSPSGRKEGQRQRPPSARALDDEVLRAIRLAGFSATPMAAP